MLKVGIGEDVHRLLPGRPLWLGGVRIPSKVGAVAHSDGDALLHALIDALVTPLTGKNIGELFPDNDPAFKNISSMELLRRTIADLFEKDIKIHNIDAVIILDKPKIGPYITEMKTKIAETLGLKISQIGIKGKTSEHTAVDRIEAMAVVLLDDGKF